MPIAKLSISKTVLPLLIRLLHDPDATDNAHASAWTCNEDFLEAWEEDPYLWAKDFQRMRKSNSRVEKPYLHVSISFDPNDPQQIALSDEQLLAFGKSYLEEMKLQHLQWIIFVRRDKPHLRIHFVVNRVGPEDSRAYNLSWSKLRFMQGLRVVEKAYGLKSPPRTGRLYQPTSAEAHSLKRKGPLPWKFDTAKRIDEAVKACDGTWENFLYHLKGHGVEARVARNGRGLAFRLKFTVDNEGEWIVIKASTLGRPYKLDALRDRVHAQSNANAASKAG